MDMRYLAGDDVVVVVVYWSYVNSRLVKTGKHSSTNVDKRLGTLIFISAKFDVN